MEDPKSFWTSKMMSFEIGADGQEIGAPDAELVQRRVWPGRAGCFHTPRLTDRRKNERIAGKELSALLVEGYLRPRLQSGIGLPHSTTWRNFASSGKAR